MATEIERRRKQKFVWDSNHNCFSVGEVGLVQIYLLVTSSVQGIYQHKTANQTQEMGVDC